MSAPGRSYRRVRGWAVLRGGRMHTLSVYATRAEAESVCDRWNTITSTPPARVVEIVELRAGEAVIKEGAA